MPLPVAPARFAMFADIFTLLSGVLPVYAGVGSLLAREVGPIRCGFSFRVP